MITNIGITSIIGFWIGISVRRNFTNNRAVKEYFLLECKQIKIDYNEFFNTVNCNSKSASSIMSWFKIMSIRINLFETFLKKEFKVDPDVLKSHNRLKQFLTETDEFGEHYKEQSVPFSSSTKRQIIEFYEEFSKELITVVIEINKASKRHHWFDGISFFHKRNK